MTRNTMKKIGSQMTNEKNNFSVPAKGLISLIFKDPLQISKRKKNGQYKIECSM